MQTDPALEFRRLTEHYRSLGDSELRDLAADFNDLTPSAQQVLSVEMQNRGMPDPQTAPQSLSPSSLSSQVAVRQNDSLFFQSAPAEVLDTDSDAGVKEADDEELSHDLTWMTYLCECETVQQALQLREALRRAAIDAAVQSNGLVYPRVMVAADQLEQAQAVAARPIPQEIIDDSKIEVPEFVVPDCPRCGAGDPVLESVDPRNSWHCEQCDADWTDPEEGQ